MMKFHLLLRHNLAGKLFNHLIVFLINVEIVRHLGAESSGDYFNELYLLSFISFGFSLGLDFAVIRLISQEQALAGLLKSRLTIVSLIFTLLALIAAVLFYGNQDLIRQPITAMVLFASGNLMLILYQGWLSALKKFNTQNFILILTNLCFLVWIRFFMDDSGFYFIVIPAAYGALFFIQGLIMYLFCRVPSAAGSATVSWKQLLGSGYLVMISSLVYFAFLRVDNFFVEAYCSSGELSNYVQCGKVGQYFIYFSTVISSSLLPFMREEGIAQSYAEWKKILRPYVLMLVAAAIILAITGPFLFPFLFGSDFAGMQTYLLIFLPGFLALGLLTLMNAVYLGKGNIRPIFIGDVSGLIMVVLADWVVVPRYGALGAAAVSSAAYCLISVYLFAGLRRQFEKPARDAVINHL